MWTLHSSPVRSWSQVNAGKLRMLLLTNKMRGFPDVPIITELGYKQDLLFPGSHYTRPLEFLMK